MGPCNKSLTMWDLHGALAFPKVPFRVSWGFLMVYNRLLNYEGLYSALPEARGPGAKLRGGCADGPPPRAGLGRFQLWHARVSVTSGASCMYLCIYGSYVHTYTCYICILMNEQVEK